MRAAALLVVGLVLPACAAADEVTDQLEQARRYYEQGDVAGAIDELEFTLQALRGRIGQELLATFPEPADGWTVADSDGGGQAAAIPFAAAGTMLGRTYRAAQGGASIEAQLTSGGGSCKASPGC